MKRHLLFLFGLIISASMFAQTPQGISHQAVMRDAQGDLIANSPIGIQVSILQESMVGVAVYVERHEPVSNDNGLITYVIGQGAALEGSFETIVWGSGNYFLKTEVDIEGGVNYTLSGTTQLLSVPYALHAQTAGEYSETDPLFTEWDKSEGIVITEEQITDLQNYLTNIFGESIDDLADVDLTGLAAGKVLKYDDDLEKWVVAEDLGLTEETDPVFIAWDKSEGILISESQIEDLQAYLTDITNEAIGDLSNVDLTGLEAGTILKFDADVNKWIVADDLGITEETDPLFSTWDKSEGIEITEDQITDLQTYLLEETDPLFTTSPAAGIEHNQIINWNEAHTWGDHSTEGYLAGESDPLFMASPAADVTEANLINWDEAFSWGDHSLADYLTAETDPTWSGASDQAGDIGRTGNVGIGTTTPDAQLHTTGSLRFEGSGEPGDGKVLTSDENGNATWEPPFAMPAGSNMQTLRHDETGWIADGLLRNNGAGLGVGVNPINNTQMCLFRPAGNFGPGYANIYAVREGNVNAAPGGTSWSIFEVDAAIKGFSNWGNNYSAAVAGYGLLDYANSAAVIGSSYGGGTYGALAFKDDENALWAGYFKGNVNVTGIIRIQGGAPGEGKVLTSDASGAASWQPATANVGSALSCIDIDGNAYPTIVIGNQVWMAENLRVTKYSNGDPIPNVTGNAAWGGLTTGAYCWYNNDQAVNAKYGALYNWHAVNDARGLCPDGWRVPTDDEWTAFTNMLGGAGVAGGKLKAVSPLWNDSNTDATNSTGFSALPGGGRWSGGSFSNIGGYGYWWSSTEASSTVAWGRNVSRLSGGVYRPVNAKIVGFSLRCVRDID